MSSTRVLCLAALLVSLTSLVSCAGSGKHAPTSEMAPTPADGLSLKQRSIAPIAAFTATGELPKLRAALDEGLRAGLTVRELEEVLVQMYAYAGFPRSLNGLGVLMAVLEERRGQGIVDEQGRAPTPPPAGRSSLELGTEVQTRLVGGPVTAPYVAFSPTIDAFLKGHLFGDILARDNLDIQSREIATISALASLEGLDPQLTSHFKVALNVGLSEVQLHYLTAVIGEKISGARGDNARKVLAEVLRNRQSRPQPLPTPVAAPAASSESPKVSVRRLQEQVVENAPAEHFTGTARVRRLFQPISGTKAAGAYAAFEPGARTAWHVHPQGQTLIVTEGSGWVQQRGEPAQIINVGDVVWIPPATEHWHGAGSSSAMTHLAVQEHVDGKTVQWLEKVTDEQYQAAERSR